MIGITIPMVAADIEKNSFGSLTTQDYYGQEWNVDADGPLFPPEGNWTNYSAHSLRLSTAEAETFAYYKFLIPGTQVQNGMQIGIYFCDWAALTWAGGPDLRVYNYDTSSWYIWGDVGDQDSLTWVWKTTYNSNVYVSNEGYIWVSIQAEDIDDTILDTIAIQYTIVVVIPTVATNAATNILCNSATLIGNLVNMGGAETCEVWFQYGLTTSYGSETAHQIKSSTGSFTKNISSLSSSTTYHFRAVASNSGGTSYGSDMTFTIPAFIAEAGGLYTGTKSNPVSFSGNATGGCSPYTYSWTFGDGGSGTGQNPTHQYTNNGNYAATLKIKDSQGNTASDTTSVTISTPTLIANANGPYNGYTGMSIDFTGSATGGCTPYTYSWKFGDNQSSTQQNPTHTYSKPGVYTMILTVTDNNSDTDIDITSVTILASGLDVDTGGPYYGEVDVPIQFTGGAFGGTSPYSYSWDFDDSDGIQVDSTLQNPTFIYGIPGVYNVTLTVTDDNGKTDDDRTTAFVYQSMPDLECEGTLSWANIKQRTTVNGAFTVRNNGGQGTKLDWEVDSYPDWGTWTFIPSDGSDLTPEAGEITVQVTLVAPKAKSIPLAYYLDKTVKFTGNVIIINKDNPNDKEVILVSITVSKSKAFTFLNIYEYLLYRIPFFEKILNQYYYH
ncbi:MAG: PKD domain-containing protein [Candidatus Thermoplasmatota archaeon]|nr:PKD domain-containing protein [Candidatus Thermoplasmatota archaeon]